MRILYRALRQLVKDHRKNQGRLAPHTQFLTDQLGGSLKVVDTFTELYRGNLHMLQKMDRSQIEHLVEKLKDKHEALKQGARFVALLSILCECKGQPVSLTQNYVCQAFLRAQKHLLVKVSFKTQDPDETGVPTLMPHLQEQPRGGDLNEEMPVYRVGADPDALKSAEIKLEKMKEMRERDQARVSSGGAKNAESLRIEELAMNAEAEKQSAMGFRGRTDKIFLAEISTLPDDCLIFRFWIQCLRLFQTLCRGRILTLALTLTLIGGSSRRFVEGETVKRLTLYWKRASCWVLGTLRW